MDAISADITRIKWNREGTVAFGFFEYEGQPSKTAFGAEAGRMLEEGLNADASGIRMTVYVDEIEPCVE